MKLIARFAAGSQIAENSSRPGRTVVRARNTYGKFTISLDLMNDNERKAAYAKSSSHTVSCRSVLL